MRDSDNSQPDQAELQVDELHVGELLRQRLAVVDVLAQELDEGRAVLDRNDPEAIARGAAHQAELCRQWSKLEEQLRMQAAKRRLLGRNREAGSSPANSPVSSLPVSSLTEARSGELAAEWAALSARIRYLTRVHGSLLRHMQRSLVVWSHVNSICQPTYALPCAGLQQSATARHRPGSGE
jgi:hypothetical protein